MHCIANEILVFSFCLFLNVSLPPSLCHCLCLLASLFTPFFPSTLHCKCSLAIHSLAKINRGLRVPIFPLPSPTWEATILSIPFPSSRSGFTELKWPGYLEGLACSRCSIISKRMNRTTTFPVFQSSCHSLFQDTLLRTCSVFPD